MRRSNTTDFIVLRVLLDNSIRTITMQNRGKGFVLSRHLAIGVAKCALQLHAPFG